MISLLLPTLGRREKELIRLFESLENQTYKDFEVIVVSQGNHDIVKNCLSKFDFKYTHIVSDTIGLSIARNIGLKHINGDIYTLSDDDCWYENDSLEFVNNFFKQHDSDIACFQYYDLDRKIYAKEYPKEAIYDFPKMRVLKQASIDIYINTSKVKDYTIGFDERFGVGGRYNSGEENIYLMDLKNLGYKFDYYPKILAYHEVRENDYLDDKSFVAKAALFKRLFGRYKGLIMYTAFAAKKFSKVDNVIKLYLKGIKEYFKFKL
ncbi:glycosyltransferase family 2 protein [Romboutsia maritimum]|uniref:Glycosyltransferase family 2 protein n=1 Tax=Romboutsia maritimum TaxID=2020948 RepID=A0A371IX20_9FIRM|nr:glycosyltransferase family 2 protein [Romboutsia maritimum]RDY25018.1 glycosyltransferase family 2 protein [Romboutsia maritimum]